jgi:hypothetical protein
MVSVLASSAVDCGLYGRVKPKTMNYWPGQIVVKISHTCINFDILLLLLSDIYAKHKNCIQQKPKKK